MAYRTRKSEEGAVDDFSADVLKMMGYEKVGRKVCINMNIRLLICGHTTRARTDVCIIGSEEVLLLLQEDKSYVSTDDAEAQLIAEAVAAFQYNNRIRKDSGLKELDEHTFLCVKMCGTHPVFYKIRIDKFLDEAISLGRVCEEEKIVYEFNPTLNMGNRRMEMIEARKRILKCFKSFRRFYEESSTAVEEGVLCNE